MCDCFGFPPGSAAHAHSPARNMPSPMMTITSGWWLSHPDSATAVLVTSADSATRRGFYHKTTLHKPLPQSERSYWFLYLPCPGKYSCPELGKGGGSTTHSQVPIWEVTDFQVKMLLRLPHAFVHFQTADDFCQFSPKLLCRERIHQLFAWPEPGMLSVQ